MNKEQVYNILSKRAAQQSKQGDPIKQFLRRVLGPSVMDYKNGADILRLHLQERRKKLQKFINGIMPLRKPVPRAANSDHVKQACLLGLMKTALASVASTAGSYLRSKALGANYELYDPEARSKLVLQIINPPKATSSNDVKPDADNAESTRAGNTDTKGLPLAKTPEKPGTSDPWSRWGGKLIGGGLGGLGLYGIMSIFTKSPILRALAFLFGAGAGGYMGHTYDAYKASRVPSSKVPGNKTTT